MTQRALLGAALACLWAALGRAEVQFVEVAAEAGIAFRHQNGAEGQKYPMETMGSGAAFFDYDGDGWLDLYFVNSAGPGALYRNAGSGQFAAATDEAGVADPGYGVPSLQFLAWGTLFIDYDNDGDRDLFVANGHLDDNIHLFDAVTYEQQNQLFRNEGQGHFTDMSNQVGPGLRLQQVSRGAAMGDYDNDGDLDITVANNNQPAALLRNDGGNAQHYLSLRLVGDFVGAEVRVAAGDWVRWDVVRAGSSYMCQSALRPFFGLGDRTRVDEVEIRWPSGAVQRLQDIAADQLLTVHEP